MEVTLTILIVASFGLLSIALQIKNIANPKPKKKKYKKKNKNYAPRNNYYNNIPKHTDSTNEYIESIWEELKK